MVGVVDDRQDPAPTRQIAGMEIVHVGFYHLSDEA